MPLRKTASPAPVELTRRLFFDTNTREIVTMDDMLRDYTPWVVDAVTENGAEYVRDNPHDFSFQAYVCSCMAAYGGVLVEIANADRITVNPD